MKSLSEHNAEATAAWEERQRQWIEERKIGIACDECGGELFTPSPQGPPSGTPPTLKAQCSKCGVMVDVVQAPQPINVVGYAAPRGYPAQHTALGGDPCPICGEKWSEHTQSDFAEHTKAGEQ